VGESLDMVKQSDDPDRSELAQFYTERMQSMKSFFNTLDKLVATVLALDDLGLGTIKKLFGKNKES